MPTQRILQTARRRSRHLIARCGGAKLSLPGGCQLGKRPIDLHLAALRQMGAEIEEAGGEISCRAEELHEEYAYEPDELEALLVRAGFSRIKQYGERKLRAPKAGEGRIFFAARKES